eukprot:scaffold279711_cov29-Prasinocladus_malaysianus.AAC.1
MLHFQEQQEMAMASVQAGFKVPSRRLTELVEGLLKPKNGNTLFSFDAVSVGNLASGPVMVMVNLFRHDYAKLTEAAVRL